MSWVSLDDLRLWLSANIYEDNVQLLLLLLINVIKYNRNETIIYNEHFIINDVIVIIIIRQYIINKM